MVRLSAIYVAFCMMLIAVSIGVALFVGFALNGPEATIVAIGALTALALYDAVAKQLRSRSIVSEQIANLSRGTADLAWQVGDLTRQVAELNRRVSVNERKSDPAAEKARAAIPAFAAEIDELGTIVQQLAETVAAHETTIAEQHALMSEQALQDIGVTPEMTAEIPDHPDRAVISEPIAEIPTTTNATPKALRQEQMVATIRRALDANRADLYLQPIVSLPQRKVRYYETFTRLRNEDGSLILPADFLVAAESGGLISRIDHLVLSRAAQVVRRLLNKNRDIGVICNIATTTLTQPQSSQQLLQFFDANQELASALVLEFPQSFWRSNGPLPQASLAALAKLGVRFSMDHVTNLRMEPRELAERNIRLVKVPANLLLTIAGTPEFDIHPADLSDLMARFGISLIAERIENEETVIDLLEYEVRFGQGYLFLPPRPVRAEALQSIAEGEDTREPEPASNPQEPLPKRRTLAEAVEEIGRTGMVPMPSPGGSRA
jgi:cyclic-di-GMP phosphodiesterase, flagellum assembly factor TipF